MVNFIYWNSDCCLYHNCGPTWRRYIRRFLWHLMTTSKHIYWTICALLDFCTKYNIHCGSVRPELSPCCPNFTMTDTGPYMIIWSSVNFVFRQVGYVIVTWKPRLLILILLRMPSLVLLFTALLMTSINQLRSSKHAGIMGVIVLWSAVASCFEFFLSLFSLFCHF